MVAVAAMFMFFACDTGTTPDGPVTAAVDVESISLDEPASTIIVGATLKLTATILPEDATDKTVTWSSDDEAVATVDQTGLVTAVAAGEGKITATTTNGNKTADCVVTVEEAVIAVTGVQISHDDTLIIEGGTFQLTANVLPANASNQNITWSSSDESKATVDQTGLVTALVPGTTTVKVISEDSGLEAACVVTVTEDWLGEVSFFSENTWTVDNLIWSDGLMAERCRKDVFDAGTEAGPHVMDCMQNLGTMGIGDPANPQWSDWFSWQVLETYGDDMCPDDWRLATKDDYQMLINRWGVGTPMSMPYEYISEWGAQLSGYTYWHHGEGYNNQQYQNQNMFGEYWAYTTDIPVVFRLGTYSGVYLDNYDFRNLGLTVRCVKDVE